MEPSQNPRRTRDIVQTVTLPFAAIALLLSAQEIGAQEMAMNGGAEAEVTFTRDVAPILQANCQACHQPNSIAPMSLMTYEQARRWAGAIETQIEARNMPPYHYDPGVGIQRLKDDRRLTEQEIQTVVRWIESGTPEGDPDDMPPPVEWPDASQWQMSAELGPPDLVIPSKPYTIPAEGPDIWFRPVVDTGILEDRCIRAIEVKPSVAGRPMTHHAIPSFRVQNDDGDGPGGRGGRGGFGGAGTLTEYALGKRGELIPENACRLAPANSQVSWEIHYSPQGVEVPDDVVEVGLWLYPEGHEPKYMQNLRNYRLERQGPGPIIDLAPHSTDMTQGFYSWDHPVRIDSFMPHGHYRLRAAWMEVYHTSTGRREILSMVSNFNPGWQNSYTYEDDASPLLEPGDVLILTAFHDNTANNPYNPDPDQWVMRGSRTTDEMSHHWLAVTHLDDAEYQRLKAEREVMAQEEDSPGGDD